MAFFCPTTGIRLVAPGLHESVNPSGVPAFDHADPAHHAAEHAAHAVLHNTPRGATEAPAPATVEAAQKAAREAFHKVSEEAARARHLRAQEASARRRAEEAAAQQRALEIAAEQKAAEEEPPALPAETPAHPGKPKGDKPKN